MKNKKPETLKNDPAASETPVDSETSDYGAEHFELDVNEAKQATKSQSSESEPQQKSRGDGSSVNQSANRGGNPRR